MKNLLFRFILTLIYLMAFGHTASADEAGFKAMAHRLNMRMEERGMGIIQYRTGDKAFESSVETGPCLVPSDPKEREKGEKRLAAYYAKEGPWMDFSYTSSMIPPSLEVINGWNASYKHHIAKAYLYDKKQGCLAATFFTDPGLPSSALESFIKRFASEVDEFNAYLKKSSKVH